MFYPTFKAEVARRGLKPVDVVMDALKCSQKTAHNKVTGTTSITLVETTIIRDKYFPKMTLDDLFLPIEVSTEEDVQSYG
ncbi:MAG: hypothetical protein Q8911_00215 [Bacillota bacterium]|nr:hypothetical protein [Bacillota bacterium]